MRACESCLTKPHGFSLSAASSFYESFVPGSGMAAANVAGALTLAFRLHRSFDAVAVSLEEQIATSVLRLPPFTRCGVDVRASPRSASRPRARCRIRFYETPSITWFGSSSVRAVLPRIASRCSG